MQNKFIYAAALLLFASACCKVKKESVYQGCCGVEPIEDIVMVATPDYDSNGNIVDSMVEAHIYIPNIFVPDTNNLQGLNETFKFFFGKGVYLATDVVYSNENGDVYYHKENFYPNSDNFFDGWNGLKPDGSLHYGKFNYKISVEFLDGQKKTYIGEACSFKCGDDGFPLGNVPSCFFPSQNNGNGALDKSLPGSGNCF